MNFIKEKKKQSHEARLGLPALAQRGNPKGEPMRLIPSILVAALALSACVEATDVPPSDAEFEAFEASLFKEDRPNGAWIVEGDIAIHTRAELRAWFERHRAHAGGLEHSQAKLMLDQSWGAEQKHDLSYCVSTDFGASQGAVIEAMHEAARAWEAHVDVRFVHRQEFDADCDNAQTGVLFNVSHANNNPDYSARAFFPGAGRAEREVLITPSVYTRSKTATWTAKTHAGVLKHELGHTLGMRHEHPRLADFGRPTCSDEDKDDGTDLTSYDAWSVMHYHACGDRDGSYDYFLTKRDIQGARSVYGAAHTSLIALRTRNGHFFTADGGDLRADADRLGPAETFQMLRLEGDRVALRSLTREFVVADNAGYGDARVDRDYLGDWEVFRFIRHSNGEVSFRSNVARRYLTALGEGGGDVTMLNGFMGNWTRFDMIRLDEQVAFQNKDGKYLRSQFLSRVRPKNLRIDRYTSFALVHLGNDEVALRTVEGRYLAARNGGGSLMDAKADTIGPWETFTLHDEGGGKVTLESQNGDSVRSWGTASARVDSSAFVASAKLRMLRTEGEKTVAIRVHDGHFVTALESGGWELDAAGDQVQSWELFALVELGGGKIALRARNGNVVRAVDGGGQGVVADRDWIDLHETFRRYAAPGGKVYLRAHDDHFLCAEGGGDELLMANRPNPGPWERFELVEIF